MLHKEKRVLRNLGSREEPYWAFVPVEFAGPKRVVHVPSVQERLEAKPKAKAFANPRSHGYGGGETPWPFDRQRAMVDGRYRAGIRNAINADWTASNWQFVATRLLNEVLEDLLAQSSE